MKKLFTVSLFALFLFGGIQVNAQVVGDDILYFCERYDSNTGEVNASDRFTTGKLTVVVQLAMPIYFDSVTIQLDKYNNKTRDFEYYNDQEFTVDPDLHYIYFSDIQFSDKGIYRVFLLAPDRSTITSGLIEII